MTNTQSLSISIITSTERGVLLFVICNLQFVIPHPQFVICHSPPAIGFAANKTIWAVGLTGFLRGAAGADLSFLREGRGV